MSIGLFPATHDEDALVSSLSQAHPTLFYTVVEQSSVAISLTGPDARIVYANQAFCQLTGYRRDELLGQDHRILASQQTPRELYPQMWHNLAQGQPWSGQLINRKRDHSLYLAEVSISPIVDRHGRLEHYLAMHKDISDRYALEQRLRNNFSLITSVLNNIPVAVV
ncbi:PAS domain-containing protein, partial [Pantoea sp. B65]|uniref:PAS domain-containing protein n=1 Tax=Pantoea sp. B65 TaxID=2813359 RepID=UPI0039B64C80